MVVVPLLCAWCLNAQTVGGPGAPAVIIFLHSVLQSVETGKTATLAKALGVQEGDVAIIAGVGRAYSDAERRLREEARSYTSGQRQSAKPMDATTIRGFSTRREELSNAAWGTIRSQMSAPSYTALLKHLQQLEGSIVTWSAQ